MKTLPKDLDDTYARILQNIDDEGYGDRVAKILRWLAYSKRPMLLTEVAEVLTVDVNDDPRVDAEQRLENVQDLLIICSSLVSTVHQKLFNRSYPTEYGEEHEILQFAHFSVREYLGSPRLHDGPAKKFAIDEMSANTFIAESCLAYILQFENHPRVQIYEKYPLVNYAAYYMRDHARDAGESGRIVPLSKRLCRSEGGTLPLLFRRKRGCRLDVNSQGRRWPLHYAILFDLPRTTSELILEGADVNARSSSGWTPLYRVSYHFRERADLVQLLIVEWSH